MRKYEKREYRCGLDHIEEFWVVTDESGNERRLTFDGWVQQPLSPFECRDCGSRGLSIGYGISIGCPDGCLMPLWETRE
jgi:hypothetical protein